MEVRDIYGTEIKPGDILLNVESARAPFDAWAYLICVYSFNRKELLIRDFNAWNVGWDSEKTIVAGHYRDPRMHEILEINQQKVEDLLQYCEGDYEQ